MGATFVLSLVLIVLVASGSQTDLLQFKKEHSRWPSQSELDAWNREMHGRRLKAKRVTAAARSAKCGRSRNLNRADREI
jgi:hypothetical protein